MPAVSGIVRTLGAPDGAADAGPMRSIVPLVDVMAGMISASSVLAALLHRERTGRGQRLGMALVDFAVIVTNDLAQDYPNTGEVPHRIGNRSRLLAELRRLIAGSSYFVSLLSIHVGPLKSE